MDFFPVGGLNSAERCFSFSFPFLYYLSGEDPRSDIQELENELELQQQQIKDLQSKLEQERKVREMLVLRLGDEQRARLVSCKKLKRN